MMRVYSDLHTHTVFSHGRNTAEENVRAALQKGLKAVAIADHAPAHLFYGVRNVEGYLKALEALKKKYAAHIGVLSGLELNMVSLNGALEVGTDVLDKLDVRILGFHKAVWYKDLKSAAHFYLKRTAKYNGKADGLAVTTQSYIRAIEKNRIDILAHPGYAVALDHARLADCCARNGVLVELNAAHCELDAQTISIYKKAGARFVVSSDAHAARDVGIFEGALKLAESAGLSAEDIANAQGV